MVLVKNSKTKNFENNCVRNEISITKNVWNFSIKASLTVKIIVRGLLPKTSLYRSIFTATALTDLSVVEPLKKWSHRFSGVSTKTKERRIRNSNFKTHLGNLITLNVKFNPF